MVDIEFEKIKALTDEFLDRPLADFPSEEELAQQQMLSDRFLRRMEKLIRKARRKQNRLDRQLVAADSRSKTTIRKRLLVAVIIVSVLASAVSVYANREAVASFIVEVFEKFTSIRFPQTTEPSGSIPETDPPGVITDHLPTLIPEGYTVTEKITTSSLIQIVYVDKSGAELIFMKAPKSSAQFGLDTEGAEVEQLTVNGYPGFYYTKNSLGSLIWSDNYYAYSIIGKITKEAMLDLANSTK
jgi:hypothetical protein